MKILPELPEPEEHVDVDTRVLSRVEDGTSYVDGRTGVAAGAALPVLRPYRSTIVLNSYTADGFGRRTWAARQGAGFRVREGREQTGAAARVSRLDRDALRRVPRHQQAEGTLGVLPLAKAVFVNQR